MTTSCETELVIDFGEVGYRNDRHPFRVRLKADGLWALFKDATAAHRIYELLLIERPGDVWDYVSVVVEAAPPDVLQRVARDRCTTTRELAATPPNPLAALPFDAFDRLFHWAGDDTEPEDQAWLTHKDAPTVRAFARQLLAAAGSTRDRLQAVDPLVGHAVDRVRANEHPHAFLAREAAIRQGREHAPNPPSHTEAFYRQLERLLRDPELASASYRAGGDHRVLRAMATEQRRRASLTGHKPGHALHLSALCNHRASNEGWGSEIWFYEEGLGHGDLYIQGIGRMGGAPLKALVECHGHVPGRYILGAADEGDIIGFDREPGEGYALYRRQAPEPRRVGLERLEYRRSSPLGPVMAFSDTGATLFDHDKTVVVIGDSVSPQARSTLADIMAEWQHKGGDPVLFVLGDRQPFELAGCRSLSPADIDSNDSPVALEAALRDVRPWADAIIALDAPEWSRRALAALIGSQAAPWRPWVVTHGDAGSLAPHHIIDGELHQALRRARERARRMRPR